MVTEKQEIAAQENRVHALVSFFHRCQDSQMTRKGHGTEKERLGTSV